MRTSVTIPLLLLLAAGCGAAATSGDDVSGDDDDDPIDAAGGDDDHDAGDDPPPDAGDDPPPDAGGPVADDPADAGDHTVTAAEATVETSLGDAAVTSYTPSGAGTFPLVVLSTGFQIGMDNYDLIARHIASWGYVVLAHDYTSGSHDEKADEIGELVDWALGSSSGLAGRIDAQHIATVGHSLGGKVSIGAAIADPRIDVVVGWDPVDALPPFGNDGSTSFTPEQMGELTAAILLIGETTDSTAGGFGQACAPAADNYQKFFEEACNASAALEVTIGGADHTDWVDDRSSCGFACLVCATGTTDDAAVRTINRRATVAWLETHLKGASGLGGYLTAPGIGSPATVRATVPGCP